MRILNLIDSFQYARTNCFQHQLLEAVDTRFATINTVELSTALSDPAQYRKYDGYISCLKLRTLASKYEAIKGFVENKKISVYDQDPWESFRDDGPWKDSYYKIASSLNTTFHVTSSTWSNFVSARGLKCHFVPMWVLPKYCTIPEVGEHRKLHMGFVGQLHPYRKELFDYMNSIGVGVHHLATQTEYRKFLGTLGCLRIFVHAEELPLICEGVECNLKNGLFIKDIEALSQGCFSIRNEGESKEDYWLNQCNSFHTYKEFGDILNILEQIKSTGFDIKFAEKIKNNNRWNDTVEMLMQNSL